MKKKLAILGIVGLPSNYGGFESFAEQLVQRLWDDYEVTVFCQRSAYREHSGTFCGKVALRYLPFKANGIWSIPYDMLGMLKALRFADTLLVLGVSGCVLLPLLRLLGCRKRIVVNIDGIEWKRAKWSGFARWFLHFSERCAVKYADAVVGDNQVIVDYVKEAYRRPCHLLEYGADDTAPGQAPGEEAHVAPSPLAGEFAFGVCRIEPENNVHLILEAFGEGGMPMPLVMVGNWQRSDYGRNLRETYGSRPGITLLDPIYDQGKLNAYRGNCALYLHGHSCGGTNPSLVEAMYLNLPIAAYDCNFNRETTENKALYFSSAQELRKHIRETPPEARRRIAQAMGEIARRRYTWKRIAQGYADLF